jgi:hypothetical protein
MIVKILSDIMISFPFGIYPEVVLQNHVIFFTIIFLWSQPILFSNDLNGLHAQ